MPCAVLKEGNKTKRHWSRSVSGMVLGSGDLTGDGTAEATPKMLDLILETAGDEDESSDGDGDEDGEGGSIMQQQEGGRGRQQYANPMAPVGSGKKKQGGGSSKIKKPNLLGRKKNKKQEGEAGGGTANPMFNVRTHPLPRAALAARLPTDPC